MNVDEPNGEASNQNPGTGADESQGESNAPQGKPADAPSGSEGQGDKPADAPKPGDTPEDKSKEGEKPDDGKPKDDKAGEGAPEQYEQFTIPEDFALEGERLEATVALFKRAGLTQAEAQAEIDRFTADVTRVHDALGEKHAAKVEEWGTQLKADPDFGGAGFEANLDTAGKFVAEVGAQPLIDLLDQYGLGNHPALNKAMLKAATLVNDLQRQLKAATGEPGDMPGSGTQHSGGGSIAERMYPGMGKT